MNTKVYVDGPTVANTESELVGMFSVYGNVVDVNVAIDRAQHNLRAFGFVTMATPEGARSAIQALNGKPIGTGNLTVCEACPAERQAGSPNGRRSPRRTTRLLY
jgi:RNA recognition motif-containing protein